MKWCRKFSRCWYLETPGLDAWRFQKIKLPELSWAQFANFELLRSFYFDRGLQCFDNFWQIKRSKKNSCVVLMRMLPIEMMEEEFTSFSDCIQEDHSGECSFPLISSMNPFFDFSRNSLMRALMRISWKSFSGYGQTRRGFPIRYDLQISAPRRVMRPLWPAPQIPLGVTFQNSSKSCFRDASMNSFGDSF